MKAVLEFNLPEDNIEFDYAVKSGDMHSCLWEMEQWLRAELKYNIDSKSHDTIKAYQEVRDRFNYILREHNIDLYK